MTQVEGERRTPRVVIFGDVIDDIIVSPREAIRRDDDTPARIERRAGGSAANTAVWLASFGCHVDFIGRVHSSDVTRHSSLMSEWGVRPHLLGEPDLSTGAIVVIVEPDGARTMLTERGANSVTSPRDVTARHRATKDHIHFTGYTVFDSSSSAPFHTLIDDAHADSLTVSLDPGSAGFVSDFGAAAFRERVRGADIVLPNLAEGVALTGLSDPELIVDELLSDFSCVVLTLGEAGAIAATRAGHRVRAKAIPVEAVDTTGAGDAFCAAFLASYLASDKASEDLADALNQGIGAAAEAITHAGARPIHVV